MHRDSFESQLTTICLEYLDKNIYLQDYRQGFRKELRITYSFRKCFQDAGTEPETEASNVSICKLPWSGELPKISLWIV